MLVEALEQKQKDLGLDQRAMARRLGVSEAMWSLVRRDLRMPGRGFIKAVLQRFPELSSEALIFLRGDMRPVRSKVFRTHVESPESVHAGQGGPKEAVAVETGTRAKRQPKNGKEVIV